MWTERELCDAFQALGLAQGNVVLVHSALRQLGAVEGGADTVINALIAVVGPTGLIAVPTHTWKVVNAQQPVFHQTLTPSNVGALTNVFRLCPDAIRSLHPTHSIAALGPRATEFITGHERDDTPCGRNSPYARLRDWGGKILIIGPGLECCTFFHGCEEWASLPEAVSEQPVLLYSITAAGQVISVPSRHHVRNTWDQYPRFESGLITCGALTVGHIGTCGLRLLDARRAAEYVIACLRDDPSIIAPAVEA